MSWAWAHQQHKMTHEIIQIFHLCFFFFRMSISSGEIHVFSMNCLHFPLGSRVIMNQNFLFLLKTCGIWLTSRPQWFLPVKESRIFSKEFATCDEFEDLLIAHCRRLRIPRWELYKRGFYIDIIGFDVQIRKSGEVGLWVQIFRMGFTMVKYEFL